MENTGEDGSLVGLLAKMKLVDPKGQKVVVRVLAEDGLVHMEAVGMLMVNSKTLKAIQGRSVIAPAATKQPESFGTLMRRYRKSIWSQTLSTLQSLPNHQVALRPNVVLSGYKNLPAEIKNKVSHSSPAS